MPSLLTTAAAVGFALLFGLPIDDPGIWWIAAIMLLAQVSISALNEWADRDLDARSGRRRPIPLGLVSPRTAVLVAAAAAVAALLLSFASGFGILALVLVFLGIACGWAYDLVLKRTPLSFLPFALAFPLVPIWAGVVAGLQLSAFGILLPGGAALAVAIHLADAIPDRDSDRRAGVNTLAVTLGRPAAEFLAFGLLLVGTLVSGIALSGRGGMTTFGVSIAALAAAYLVLTLRSPARTPAWSPVVAKWILVLAALVAALPLVIAIRG